MQCLSFEKPHGCQNTKQILDIRENFRSATPKKTPELNHDSRASLQYLSHCRGNGLDSVFGFGVGLHRDHRHCRPRLGARPRRPLILASQSRRLVRIRPPAWWLQRLDLECRRRRLTPRIRRFWFITLFVSRRPLLPLLEFLHRLLVNLSDFMMVILAECVMACLKGPLPLDVVRLVILTTPPPLRERLEDLMQVDERLCGLRIVISFVLKFG